ncbi:hypothetical protein FOZ61_000434 [Perkinsus olseni]|uniref:Uncharacterized protein n=1 Tax=Perkinsus olseni TaxID=32597 RepID=A0A7J6KSL6_PEROL|nr:hypothetical protein FOZ61_000434 [Perkinsus olseni]KAF4651694.1 hypothetical protein FOL46_000181 [Perkinsus olseni]
MVSAHSVFWTVLCVESILGLQTASKSEVDLLRRQVTELSKEVAVLPKRLDDLQKQVAHLTKVVGEGSEESPVATVEGVIKGDDNQCTLKFGDEKFSLIDKRSP